MLKKLILAGAFAAMASAPAMAGVVFSDNFDTENGGTGVLNFASFTNWNVSGGTVDLIGATGGYDLLPGNGLYVDLDGSSGAIGTLSTKSTFGPGDYMLSFSLAGSQRQDGDNTVSIMFGAVTLQTITLPSSDPFAAFSISFTATTAEAITFVQTNASDNQGLLLDNVVLSDAATTPAPEPMTLSLFGAGLAAMGLRRRKKA